MQKKWDLRGPEAQKIIKCISPTQESSPGKLKLESLLNVYEFIERWRFDFIHQHQPSYDKHNELVNELSKKLSESRFKKVVEIFDQQIFEDSISRVTPFTREYWKTTKHYISDGKHIIRKKPGRPKKDGFNLLLFLLGSLLKQSKKVKGNPFQSVYDLFVELKIKTPQRLSLERQFNNLEPQKMKEVYDFYYTKSLDSRPSEGKGLILFHRLPNLQELVSLKI